MRATRRARHRTSTRGGRELRLSVPGAMPCASASRGGVRRPVRGWAGDRSSPGAGRPGSRVHPALLRVPGDHRARADHALARDRDAVAGRGVRPEEAAVANGHVARDDGVRRHEAVTPNRRVAPDVAAAPLDVVVPDADEGWITTWSITRQLSPTWNPGHVEAHGLRRGWSARIRWPSPAHYARR